MEQYERLSPYLIFKERSITVERVRNSLRLSGFKAAAKQKKPKLSSKHKKARLEFAEHYRNYTLEEWKRVSGPTKPRSIV